MKKIICLALISMLGLTACGKEQAINTTEEPIESITIEEPVKEVKPEPIDTSNIYVYVSFYNGNEVYSNTAHNDYNCSMCRKQIFGGPLDVVQVNANDLANSNDKYKHIRFCPLCSPYSDYYINGEAN